MSKLIIPNNPLNQNPWVLYLLLPFLNYVKYVFSVPMIISCGFLVIFLLIIAIFAINFLLGNFVSQNQQALSNFITWIITTFNINNLHIETNWKTNIYIDNNKLLEIYGILSLIFAVIGETFKWIFKIKTKLPFKNKLIFIISSILSGYFVIFIFFLPFVSQGKDFQEVIVGYAVFTIFLIFTLIFTIFSMIFNYGIDFVIDLIKKELSI